LLHLRLICIKLPRIVSIVLIHSLVSLQIIRF
jgi:hypothetical protein